MKSNSKIMLFVSAITAITILSCKKEKSFGDTGMSTSSFLSGKDFLSKNKIPNQVYTINGNTGGSFTSSQGTIVTIPANAFQTQTGVAVTGNVKIEFKDIYKKSEMLLSDMPTQTIYGNPLKSAGEFFIKASVNNVDVLLNQGKKITIEQPIQNGQQLDPGMIPFVVLEDSVEQQGWFQNPGDSISYTTSTYIFSLYSFSSPLASGTWCNSDNSAYFNAYAQTALTLHANDNPDLFSTEVFLVFSGINSMVHVYRSTATNDFPYSYAPQGLQCTVVAVGAKNGKVYSSFTPITISANQTVNFTLAETTDIAFKAQLNALN